MAGSRPRHAPFWRQDRFMTVTSSSRAMAHPACAPPPPGDAGWTMDYGTGALRKSRVYARNLPPPAGIQPPALLRAEVGLTDAGIGGQGGRRATTAQGAGLEHVGPVGDPQGLVGELLDEEDRRPLGGQVGDDLEDLADEEGRQAEGRLVEQEESGGGHEAPAQGQHLLLAAGKE